MRYVLLIVIIFMLGACTTTSTKVDTGTTVVDRIPLYWENTTEAHPERKAWSDELITLFDKDFETFSKGRDITEFCPKFHSLSRDLKLKAFGEFMVAMAYYESGFNPKSSSVDVGTVSNRNSYSDGLYQLSGTDNSAKKFNCDYKCLQDPVMNIKVAMEQLRKQLDLRGKFYLDNSDSMRYWAVALVKNKYSKIPQINERVKKYAKACN
jgi:hypothetical protein